MYNTNKQSIDELHQILEKTHKRKFKRSEVKRIGRWLLKFYGHLYQTNSTDSTLDCHPQVRTGTDAKDSN